MTLAIDIRRAIRTRAELISLVETIRDADEDEHETDWLEWKRELDVGESPAHRFAVARHILGFGNREPASAAAYCEGTAYLILGVEPGLLKGVSAWDPADIDNWISKYIAPGAPRWRADTVDVDGKHVIVFTVEAPSPGDPIFTLQHGFDRSPAGRIFIRRGGKTEEASPADISKLEARLIQKQADIDITVDTQVVGDELCALDLTNEAFERWRKTEAQDLLGSLPAPRAQIELFQVALPRISLDSRSKAEFRTEVDVYLQQCKQRWLSIAYQQAIEARLAVVQLTVVNAGHRNFPASQVEVSLPPDVLAFVDESDPVELFDPPRRPHRYGSPSYLDLPDVTPIFRRQSHEIVYDDEGVIVRFPPVDVRPGRRHSLPDLHLGIPAEMGGKTLTAAWRATSTGATSWAHGNFEVQVADLPAVLTPTGGGSEDYE